MAFDPSVEGWDSTCREGEGVSKGESTGFVPEFGGTTEVESGAALGETDAMEETRQWLIGARLKKLIPVFEEFEVDMHSFKELSAEECESLINELPLNTLQKKRLRKTVGELRAKQQLAVESKVNKMEPATAKASVKTSEIGVGLVEDSKEETEMDSEPRRAAESKEKLTLEQVFDMCRKGESKALADAFAAQRIDVDIDEELDGHTCLYAAASDGQTEVVRELLRAKADVNKVNSRGWTPLIIASAMGYTATVSVLLEFGADVDISLDSGADALACARVSEHGEIVSLLLAAKKSTTGGMHSEPRRAAESKSKLSLEEVYNMCVTGESDAVKEAFATHRIDFDIDEELEGRRCLYVAVIKGHVEVARELLKAKADVNKMDSDGWTPLMIASAIGQTDMVSLLLEFRADVDITNEDGNDALHWARQRKDEEIVSLLLAAKKSTAGKSETKLSLEHVFDMCLGGESKALADAFATHRIDFDIDAEYEGRTCLLVAAVKGYTEVARELLKANANVNVKDSGNGWTPLIIASTAGHTAMVSLLLEFGADVNITLDSGTDALDLARAKNHDEIERLLLAAKKSATGGMHSEPRRAAESKEKLTLEQVFSMCVNGESEALADAFATQRIDFDIDAKDKEGRTCLYAAAIQGYTEVARVLLKAKADVDVKDSDGWTPLMMAAGFGDTATVSLLLEFGADVNISMDSGTDALSLARAKEHEEIERLLLAAKKSTTGGMHSELTLEEVFLMCHSGDSKALSEAFATHRINFDIDEKTDGITCLHIAVSKCHTEVARQLLKSKADVNKVDSDGWTALMLASASGHTAMVSLLLEFGADVNITNDRGNGALDYARSQKHEEIERLLLAAKKPSRGFEVAAYERHSEPRRAAAAESCCIIL